MSRKTSGIIINDDIFLNSEHVVKMEKYKVEGDSDENDVYVIDTVIGTHRVNLWNRSMSPF